MAPRLHRRAGHDQTDTPDHDQTAASVPVHYATEAELIWLFNLLGVNDMSGVAGAGDHTVKLSDRSEVVCPAHGRLLKPDACRSCWFLDPTRPRE